MKKVSASTLARQARDEKNPAKAKKLRAQAAKLRREERKAAMVALRREKPNKPRPAEKIIMGLKQAVQYAENRIGAEMNEALYGDNAIVGQPLVAGAQHRLNQMRAASVDSMALSGAGEPPGHGEIVGGYLAHMAEELAKLARKKGGVDAIQGRLMTLEHQNRHDEKVYARERERKAVQAIREEMRDKAVCGFIARFDASESVNTVPTSVIMAGDEIRNIIDALKANGYRADGKR